MMIPLVSYPVTDKNVRWSLYLESGIKGAPITNMAMGIGWDALLDAIKSMRGKCDEDAKDRLVASWTGNHTTTVWVWRSAEDVPALLPPPDGILLDS